MATKHADCLFRKPNDKGRDIILEVHRGNVETVVRRGHNLDIDIRTGRFDAGVLVGVFTHRFSRETIKAAETAEDDIILTFREILSKDIL
ncbi:28161_t:CDS:2, partial [Gigaspora margarita]